VNIDWVIIGGGIHGVHIAARLMSEAGVERAQIRIVDPGERLLERWRTCTETTGMTHLRSPSVHHLALDPWALKSFARKQKLGNEDVFAPPYDRPKLALFNAHCDLVIETFDLENLHVRAYATACSVGCEGVLVSLSTGQTVSARNVVLAMGMGEQPCWPDWASGGGERVEHIFDKEFDGWPTTKETLAVVGGGISAGQVALRLLNEGHRVHLISRHALREHQFDSDPGWLGPKFMTAFNRERDVDRRRALITQARHRGSVPPDVHQDLSEAIKGEELFWHKDEVDRIEPREESVRIHLTGGGTVQVARILLATGFISRRPGGALVDQLIESAGLPCADCGYPIVDSTLRWHPGIYVSGPLAELELGPTSRNIAGARRAGERLVKAAMEDRSPALMGARASPG